MVEEAADAGRRAAAAIDVDGDGCGAADTAGSSAPAHQASNRQGAQNRADFDQMYSSVGRPSVPFERLFKAALLMALYTIRTERLFCELLDYKPFRWFLVEGQIRRRMGSVRASNAQPGLVM